MPRQARRKSEIGIYHIMIRGINQQQIFEDEEDNRKFLEIIKECKKISEFELYAYCLMGNHVHLMIKVIKESIDKIVKRIGVRYVFWYNWKYKRRGHLFQDRFKSEPIDNDQYFFTVLRYIHQNPLKAGMTNSIDGYKWSSYNEYVQKQEIVDIAYALEIIDKATFIVFNNSLNNSFCLEEKPVRLTDIEVKKIMRKICNCDTVTEFLQIDTNKQKVHIKRLLDSGVSIRQASRLTGISKGIVERI